MRQYRSHYLGHLAEKKQEKMGKNMRNHYNCQIQQIENIQDEFLECVGWQIFLNSYAFTVATLLKMGWVGGKKKI